MENTRDVGQYVAVRLTVVVSAPANISRERRCLALVLSSCTGGICSCRGSSTTLTTQCPCGRQASWRTELSAGDNRTREYVNNCTKAVRHPRRLTRLKPAERAQDQRWHKIRDLCSSQSPRPIWECPDYENTYFVNCIYITNPFCFGGTIHPPRDTRRNHKATTTYRRVQRKRAKHCARNGIYVLHRNVLR